MERELPSIAQKSKPDKIGILGKEPIRTESVVNQVIRVVKDALINREISPGDKMPSAVELSQTLGVSKASVREAFKMLEAMGVLKSKQGEGTFICTEPEEDSFNSLIFQLILAQGANKDLLEFRKMFEAAYMKMAMENASEDDLKNIEHALLQFEKDSANFDHDLEFHRTCLFSTHNIFVIKIGETLLQLFEAAYKAHQTASQNKALAGTDKIPHHRNIYEALRTKDSAKLEKAILDSLSVWGKATLEVE